MHIRLSTLAGAAPLPRNPTVVEPPTGMAAFQASFCSMTIDPLTVCRPFHDWVMAWVPGKVKCTIHPFIAAAGARTVTAAWKPPDHELVVGYVAVQDPPAGGGVVVAVGPGPGGGVLDAVGSGPGGGRVVSPTPVTSPLPPSKTTSEQP